MLRVVIQEMAEQRHAQLEAATSTDFADAILARFRVIPRRGDATTRRECYDECDNVCIGCSDCIRDCDEDCPE